jgi:endonuclease/exonuclease/phosphatase family metal-dependent hydrolase
MFLNTWHSTREAQLKQYLIDQRGKVDVFCFQEAFDTRDRIGKDVLTDFTVISARRKIVGIDDDSQQVTYVSRDYQVLNTSEVSGLEGNCGVALWTEIRGSDGAVVNVINFHGLSRPIDKRDDPDRIRASQAVIKFAGSLEGPVIIGGDFNLFPDTESIGLFARNGYRNLIVEYNIPTTRNELVWERFPDSKLLYSDYAFVNNDVDVKEFVVPDKYPDNQVSDHLPLILEI